MQERETQEAKHGCMKCQLHPESAETLRVTDSPWFVSQQRCYVRVDGISKTPRHLLLSARVGSPNA